MSVDGSYAAKTEDEKVIDFVLLGNKLEHSGSPLKSGFVSMLIDHVRDRRITTVKRLHELLQGFVNHCDSPDYMQFIERADFLRSAIDSVLMHAPKRRPFERTMLDLQVLSEEIMEELEEQPGAPKSQD